MLEESLFDAIRRGGYEASLITTYHAYFPFYEEIVLRRLRASGCRHNVVLADAKQCSVALSDPIATPHCAGSEYTLVPLRSDGAFHPKILILLGRSKGALCIGSHNLTLTGFGYNRELTNLIEFSSKKNAAAVACARVVWGAIKDWLTAQARYLPPATVNAVLSVTNLVPWLGGESAVEPDPIFLAQGATTRPLLDQLANHAPKTVKSIMVVGAFFDSNLRLLKELIARWPKARLVCGIEPETVSLPGKRLAKSNFDFRDASALAGRSGYLHAKAIFFEGRDGDHLLASGSANPSAPAWLGINEEAMILRKGAQAFQVAKALGLLAVNDFRPMQAEQWEAVSTELPQDAAAERGVSAIVVSESDAGFEVTSAAFASVPLRCTARTRAGDVVELELPKRTRGDVWIIAADRSLRGDVQRLMFELKDGGIVEAIVHHSAQIDDLARSTQQTQFRVALQGLSSGSADIAKMVSSVEKVIFDDDEGIANEISRRSRAEGDAPDSDEAQPNPKPATLAVNMQDTRQAKRHRRLLKSTDLGFLLDVLVHRIGIGLATDQVALDTHGRSEEAQIDQDDDDDEGLPVHKEISDIDIARVCRRKLRKLIARMNAQMGRASADAALTPNVLVQLVAVLAVLRELRTIEKHDRWRRARAQLVDPGDARNLLDQVLCTFFGRGFGLYEKLVATLGGERFDEIARLKGLLMWLAWDCGVTLDHRYGLAEYREDVDDRVWSKAALLELVQILSGDSISLEEARSSILSVATAREHQSAARWIQECEAWTRQVEKALHRMKSNRDAARGPDAVGCLAFANAVATRRLRVVSSIGDGCVTLFDFDEEIQYRHDRVSSAEKS